MPGTPPTHARVLDAQPVAEAAERGLVAAALPQVLRDGVDDALHDVARLDLPRAAHGGLDAQVRAHAAAHDVPVRNEVPAIIIIIIIINYY